MKDASIPRESVTLLVDQGSGLRAFWGQPCGHWGWLHFRSRAAETSGQFWVFRVHPGWCGAEFLSWSPCRVTAGEAGGALSAALPSSHTARAGLPGAAGGRPSSRSRGHAALSAEGGSRAPEDPVSEDVQAFQLPGLTPLAVGGDASLQVPKPSACCRSAASEVLLSAQELSERSEQTRGRNHLQVPYACQEGTGPHLPSWTWPPAMCTCHHQPGSHSWVSVQEAAREGRLWESGLHSIRESLHVEPLSSGSAVQSAGCALQTCPTLLPDSAFPGIRQQRGAVLESTSCFSSFLGQQVNKW